jgi:hypothetical protein
MAVHSRQSPNGLVAPRIRSRLRLVARPLLLQRALPRRGARGLLRVPSRLCSESDDGGCIESADTLAFIFLKERGSCAGQRYSQITVEELSPFEGLT